VMQVPKITLFNGQCSAVVIEDQHSFVTGVDLSRRDDSIVLIPSTQILRTGLDMWLNAVISADNRTVRLTVAATDTTLDSLKSELLPVRVHTASNGDDDKSTIFTQRIQKPKFTKLNLAKTFTLPDGGTALFNVGKRSHEVDGGFRPPILADLPYVGRLFTNTGVHKETECVLMLVTPRIIVAAGEEQPKQTTAAAPKQAGATSARGASYEQEEPACCKKAKDCCATGNACCPPCPLAVGGNAPCVCCENCKVADLMKNYYKACAEGKRAEATEFAVQALALDPMCFGKAHNAKGK
jgi:hypothetical protein